MLLSENFIGGRDQPGHKSVVKNELDQLVEQPDETFPKMFSSLP
jgi:hypothetical protein